MGAYAYGRNALTLHIGQRTASVADADAVRNNYRKETQHMIRLALALLFWKPTEAVRI